MTAKTPKVLVVSPDASQLVIRYRTTYGDHVHGVGCELEGLPGTGGGLTMRLQNSDGPLRVVRVATARPDGRAAVTKPKCPQFQLAFRRSKNEPGQGALPKSRDLLQ